MTRPDAILSPELEYKIEVLFSEDDREEAARRVLSVAENFSDVEEGAFGLQRVQFAALKVSRGDLRRLDRALEIGWRDWRDLLSAAGFWNLHTHLAWVPKPGRGSPWARFREWTFGMR